MQNVPKLLLKVNVTLQLEGLQDVVMSAYLLSVVAWRDCSLLTSQMSLTSTADH